MTRKQRKKKWILAAVVVLTATLIPAEASSPDLPDQASASNYKVECRQKTIGQEVGDVDAIRYGSCAAGSSNCCYGYPEAACGGPLGIGGGGFEPV